MKPAFKPLTESDVAFEEGCEQEFIPVRGNYMATDDAEADRLAEDELLDRLEHGDSSAWCILTVKATWKGFVGHASLGGFVFPRGNSGPQNEEYAAEEYASLRIEALADLNESIQSAFEVLRERFLVDGETSQLNSAVAALAAEGYVVHRRHDGKPYISNLAPDSDGASTEPGSAWDEECNELLEAVNAIVEPHGCRAEWSDDDVSITEVAS